MHFTGLRLRTVAGALAAAAATSAFGYWGYGEFRAQLLRGEITALVEDASRRLDAALAARIEQPAALHVLYEHAEAVDGHFRRLRGAGIDAIADLAHAADDYLLTSREILLRHASSQRYRLKLAASIHTLQAHMRADDRSAEWVRAAVRAKERVEEDYRDYERTLTALNTLLGTYPAARDRIAPHVRTALLSDEQRIAAARTQAFTASTLAAREIEAVRQLRTYR